MNFTRQRNILTISLLLLTMGAVIVYATFDPAESRLFPRCPFLTLTGFQCPGCGTQRAIHALLHGNIAAAIHYNALMVAAIPIVATMIVAQIKQTKFPRLYKIVNGQIVIYGTLFLLIGWWIARNVFGL